MPIILYLSGINVKLNFILLLLCFGLCSCQKEKSQPFTTIFNGKNLDGWEGKPGMWKVEDGAIVSNGSKTRTWLVWRDGTTKDFELKLKVKFESGNSGIQVRSHEIEPFMVQGYQMEIAKRDVMGLWHHSLLPKDQKYRSHLAVAGEVVNIADDGKKEVKPFGNAEELKNAWTDGVWNDVTIIAKGPRLKQYVNGVLLSDLTDTEKRYDLKEGLLAFQDHGKGTNVAFKDIRIRHF